MVASEPRPRQRNAEATRHRLLAAAQSEFAAHGYQGARLRNIADLAGVQPALIHHYFGDKQGLYRTVLDTTLSESSTASWEILEREGDLSSVVLGFVDMLLRFNFKHRNLMNILRREANAGSPVMTVTRDVIRERTLPIIEAVRLFFERRQQRGEIRNGIDAREIIISAMSLCAYPYAEQGFLETCLPDAIIHDEASLVRRRDSIIDAVMRLIEA